MNFTAHSLSLNTEERDLLIWQVPNEVINGFRLPDFEQRIGVMEDSFRRLDVSLRRVPAGAELALERDSARVFRNALLETMSELDTEFETRTGHTLESAKRVVAKLDSFLVEPTEGEN